MARDIRVALVGFGNVGRRFAEQLRGPYARALKAAGARARVTGIATASHGLAIDVRGLDLGRALQLAGKGRSLDALHHGPRVSDVRGFIERVPADVLVEITTLEPRSGQPAIDHVRQALGRGMHVVTANKGPVAFALRPLRALAVRKERLFLHEGAVMDGTPVFNLVERCLRGARIVSFRGTLNSTTNLVLSRMEEGLTASAAVTEAQRLGIAEAMKGRIVYRTPGSEVAEAVAKGEAELGITFTSELQPNPGVKVAGTLPAAVQLPTIYSAARLAGGPNPNGAMALIALLAGAEGRRALTRAGLEPLRPTP